MLKTCQYCGIVQYDHVCPHKQKKKEITSIDKFRWTKAWQNKREEIKKRDLCLCQICIRELYDTVNKYNCDLLSVHHNIPLAENFDLRLENSNLITVCDFHHELCENGRIPREVVQKIIDEQEQKYNI